MNRASTAPVTGALPRVLLLLFAAGWAANHFTALIPVLREQEGLSSSLLAGAFGIYALGLLPGLLGGGAVSDRLGRRPLVLAGSAVAASGNLLLLAWHDGAGVNAGRFVVGLGVGLAMSAGTAWAADLGGKRGTTMAGVTLTAGFATGPFVGGLAAQALDGDVRLMVPFMATVVLSVVAIAVGGRTRSAPTPGHPAPDVAGTAPHDDGRRLATALVTSVPMALWVFSSVAVPIVYLIARMQDEYAGPWLPGVACAVALGTGIAVQAAARHREWDARAGVVGALLAAVGFVLAAVVSTAPSLAALAVACVVLGAAYGLCLRQGLVDVETLAPAARRGTALGIFYVCTYLGFGLPLLLEVLRGPVGVERPLLVLAGLALASAAFRGALLRRSGRHGPARTTA